MGVKFDDGSIDGCYVHFDGYPEHMVEAIEDYITTYTTTGLFVLISEAQSRGGIRSFNCPGLDSDLRTTDFLDDPERAVINEDNWRMKLFGAQFKYLINYSSGEIHIEE